MAVLVGGVGQLYQGDLDLGRLAAEQLAASPPGVDVLVEDLYYGAVAVAQRLAEVTPAALVLVGAVARGRPAGTVERRRIWATQLSPQDVQHAMADAVTGYVGIDLVVEVAGGLEVLPARTVAIEVEPADTSPGEGLSEPAKAGLAAAVDLVRDEVGRVPLLDLVDRLRPLVTDDRLEPAPAVDTMRELLAQLELLDEHGRWGATFRLRDRLRRRIAEGDTGYGMDHLDWGLWWTLIEELDRLQAVEAT